MEAKMWRHSCWIEVKNEHLLFNAVQELLLNSGFTILKTLQHKFKPHGFTGVWVLAESHCAIHTFPEHNTVYFELSSCSLKKYNTALTLLEELNT